MFVCVGENRTLRKSVFLYMFVTSINKKYGCWVNTSKSENLASIKNYMEIPNIMYFGGILW